MADDERLQVGKQVGGKGFDGVVFNNTGCLGDCASVAALVALEAGEAYRRWSPASCAESETTAEESTPQP